MLLAAYITAIQFLASYVYEIEVMLVVIMSVIWGLLSFRLVIAFGGAPYLEGIPCGVICSEGLIITQYVYQYSEINAM
jgi:hypothetical protein